MSKTGQSVLRHLQGCGQAFLARCGVLRGESGQALAEFGFAIALIGVPLLMGTTDLAFVVYGSIEISSAAHAGAVYGMTSATAATQTSTMQTVSQTEAADFVAANVTVTPTTYYACSSSEGGTQYTGTGSQVNSTALTNVAKVCPAGAANHYLEFVQVVVSAPVTPPFKFPGAPSSYQLSSTSVMEVEQ